MTFKYVFDYREGEIYWCTADVGWVTGHSYIVYGPLANGAITLMFEGVPTYPDAGRCWEVVDKHQVNTFYTAPTAIRALQAVGDEPVTRTSRASLRLLGTVGEPINPEAWEWYHRVVGDGRCPIVDTWWQTETGAHMITPLPGATAAQTRLGDLSPSLAWNLALLNEDGSEIEGPGRRLPGDQSPPGPARSAPFTATTSAWSTPISATIRATTSPAMAPRRDEDGYYWITGRVDDVLNVSGHRMGTAEVESALVLHDEIAEAAVVGFPHDIKGQGIYAYVTPMQGVEPSEELRQELIQLCVKEIGPIAKPDVIQWAPGLPKTRSGKIMRRILRKIAENELDNLGDTSTLADPWWWRT